MMHFRPIEEPGLVLHVAGATAEQVKRGIDAARQYFRLEGLDPEAVWIARIKIEDEGIGVPAVALTELEENIWHHWHEAEVRALVACCGAGRVPPSSCLAWQRAA